MEYFEIILQKNRDGQKNFSREGQEEKRNITEVKLRCVHH